MRFTGLYAGAESVKSHGTAISTVADDIANVNTPGFKSQRIDFADLYAEAEGNLFGNPLSPGNGVSAADKKILHNIQGAIDETGRSLDFALDGAGFFTLSDGTDQFYTRAGNFITDSSGFITNDAGLRLLGVASDGASPAPINVNTSASGATPTTKMTLSGNLNGGLADSPPPATAASFSDLNANAALKGTLVVTDSLGGQHNVAVYFYKTSNLNFAVQAYVDGSDTGGTAGTPQLVGSSTITFGSDGVIPTGGAAPMAINATWANGSAASAITADLSGFTGYSSTSALNSVAADGVTNGDVKGYNLDSDGNFSAQLDNGQSIFISRLSIAKFNNPDSLERRGSTIFAEGADTSPVSMGFAGEGGRGTTKGGALESSTVDTASEFVDLIRYQRGYQAGSKVISTISEIIERTIDIA